MTAVELGAAVPTFADLRLPIADLPIAIAD
jgi:hypothetical protein